MMIDGSDVQSDVYREQLFSVTNDLKSFFSCHIQMNLI